jgi:hypothetical protein
MGLRQATHEDIPRLLDLAQAFYDRSPYKAVGEHDKDASARALAYMIDHPDALVLTNEFGAIGGLFVPVWFSPSVKVAEVQFNEFSQGGIEAVTEFERLAKAMGAHVMHLSRFADQRAAAADRLLGAHGYRPVERRYVKEL